MTTRQRPPVLKPELADAYFAWLDYAGRERQERSIRALEALRRDEGPLWALFGSAYFHGPEVRRWRLELIAELEEKLS